MEPARKSVWRCWPAGPLSLLLALSPLSFERGHDAAWPKLQVSAAMAKDGRGGGGDSDRGGDSGRGDDRDDRADDREDRADDRADDREDRRDDRQDAQEDRRDDRERNDRTGPNGEEIEWTDEGIRVRYPDGYLEILAGGMFRMEDPRGRTVIERRATPADTARVEALLR